VNCKRICSELKEYEFFGSSTICPKRRKKAFTNLCEGPNDRLLKKSENGIKNICLLDTNFDMQLTNVKVLCDRHDGIDRQQSSSSARS